MSQNTKVSYGNLFSEQKPKVPSHNTKSIVQTLSEEYEQKEIQNSLRDFKELYDQDVQWQGHLRTLAKLTNPKCIKQLIDLKINDYRTLHEIKNKYWDFFKSWFKKQQNQFKGQLECLFIQTQEIYLFQEAHIERQWRERVRNFLPQDLWFGFENPFVPNRDEQNYVLTQLRYILKQNSNVPSLQRRTCHFILQLLQELSPLSQFHMKLYLALSEKGRNSVNFVYNTTHYQSKSNNDLENFQLKNDIKLFVQGDQDNQNLLTNLKPKKNSLLDLCQKRRKSVRENIQNKRPKLDCDNIVKEQALYKNVL